MGNRYNPLRLTADLSLLKTDTQQLGLHLRWLLADLQEQQGQLNGQAGAFAGLATELNAYLPRLDELDALLLRFEQLTQVALQGRGDLAEPTPQSS